MVYVKKPNGKIVKVHFGDPNMKIKRIFLKEGSLLEQGIDVITQDLDGKQGTGLVKLGNGKNNFKTIQSKRKKRRPGIHSKNRSRLKTSKGYKKPYNKQGR